MCILRPLRKMLKRRPGFPQDAFMEMGMDELVQKPETHGLPKNWSAGMMGMMTMVRVLPDEKYEEIMRMKGKPVCGGKRAPPMNRRHNNNSRRDSGALRFC